MDMRMRRPARRTRRWAGWLASLAGLLACGTSDAARFVNLYQATVMVDPNAADSPVSPTTQALATVLVRVTGNRQAAFDPQLLALADNPDLLTARGTDAQGRMLFRFSPRLVDQALTSLGWPVWGDERPLTLIWVAVDDGVGERSLLGANDASVQVTQPMADQLKAIRAELNAVAEERGLPISLPLLDLEDLSAVAFQDVWGGFDDRITQASTRYRADAVLIGKIGPGVSGTEVQWTLVRGGERRVLAGVAVRDGLEAIADLYAADLSATGPAATTLISVLDVGSPADYGRVMSYLESLSVLQSVDVESLESGALNLRVNARGGAQVLERVLALGGVLTPASSGAAPPGGALTFKVNRGPAR
jgi:hypothetical protein